MGTHVRRLLRHGLVISALGLLTLSGCLPDNPSVSNDLITAFGGACSPVGAWTQSALGQNKALVQTLVNLENDPQCKPFLSSMMTVQNAVSQANVLLQDDQFLKYRADEEQVQDLALALKTPPSDPTLASQLQSQLVLAQLDLYQSRAMERASQTVAEKDRYGRSTAELAQFLQTIVSAQNDGTMSGCLKAHPEAAVGIAANLLALGGSFVSPIYGAGFAAVGQLLTIGVAEANSHATDDAIWKLHQTTMPTALTCALESMSELYCDAVDSLELLELKKESVLSGGSGHTAPIWRGIDLLSVRMPVLNDWLSQVRNGITPTDPGLATKQNAILDKMTSVDKTYNSVFASLNEDQRSYDDSPQAQKTNQMVKTILDQVMLAMGMSLTCPQCSTSSTPFTELTMDPKNYACWFVMGMVPREKCLVSDSTETLEGYIGKLLISNQLDFKSLFLNWTQIYSAVKGRVYAEFNRTITANPSSLIADAYESSPSNVSPHEVLEMLVKYFKDLKGAGGAHNPAYQPHLDETIQLIEKVLSTLDPSSALPEDNNLPSDMDPSVRRITEIFKIFELNRGIGIFADRVSRIVQWDLNTKVENGEFPKNLNEILMLAGTTFKDRLIQSGQGQSDGALNVDLGTAKQIAEGNIKNFRDVFSKHMSESVEMLQKAAVEAGEPLRGSDRANGQVLGHLCTLILATGGEWPKGFDPSICMQAYLDPLYGGHGSPAFSIEVGKLAKELEGKPYTNRFCAYHRYLRAERLAEMPSVIGRSGQSDPSRQSLGALMGWTNFNLMEMMVR